MEKGLMKTIIIGFFIMVALIVIGFYVLREVKQAKIMQAKKEVISEVIGKASQIFPRK